jgi:hypothetical protein
LPSSSTVKIREHLGKLGSSMSVEKNAGITNRSPIVTHLVLGDRMTVTRTCPSLAIRA